jgi:hypothetical protein
MAHSDSPAEHSIVLKMVKSSGLAPFTEEKVLDTGAKLLLCTTHDSKGPVKVWCDGRECRLCHLKDWDADLTFPLECLTWAYPPKDAKNRGMICFVCIRVYEAEFEHAAQVIALARMKGVTLLSAFILLYGTEIEVNKRFWMLHAACLGVFKRECKSRRLRINWEVIRKEVQQFKTHEYEEATLPDEVWPYLDYCQEPLFGAPPETNGKNHTVVFREGEKCVLIPAKRRWTITRRKREGVTEMSVKMACVWFNRATPLC